MSIKDNIRMDKPDATDEEIINADNIYVMSDGKIAESGTHNELLSKGGIYNHMWNEYNKSVNWQVGKAGKK